MEEEKPRRRFQFEDGALLRQVVIVTGVSIK